VYKKKKKRDSRCEMRLIIGEKKDQPNWVPNPNNSQREREREKTKKKIDERENEKKT